MKVVKNKNKKKKNYIKKYKTKFNKIKKEINLNIKKHSKKINNLKKVNIKKQYKIFITKIKKLDFKEVLKKLKKNIIEYSKKYYYILLMAIPFILIDIITRIIGQKINFYGIGRLVPNLFTTIWLILFIGISLSLEKKKGKLLYILLFIISFLLFITNNIYYSMTDSFFSFNLLGLASEGSAYFMDAIINCNIWVYISSIVIIITFIIGLKYYPIVEQTNKKRIIYLFITFIILHIITPCFLGKANDELEWSTWRNPRNIYINYNDSNKSLMISGIYEYSFRDFYITYLKAKKTRNEDELNFLEEEYLKSEENYLNNYTGKYQDKNLIIIQLEGLDSWMLTEEDTPTLYSMINNSINFTNHYSYYNGGGSTFNSEFAVNTGMITPLSYTQNAYTFNKNAFPYSLANLFKDRGYRVNAFHMNTSEYYSRGVNYKNWGYDNYYGLQDLGTYVDDSYILDRELILNEEFNQKLFENEKFVDYIIAYASHLPFSTSSGVCKKLITEDIIKELNLYDKYNEGLVKISYKKEPKEDNPLEKNLLLTLEESFLDSGEKQLYEVQMPEMTEEQCARRQAKETDYMVELLLQNLRDKNLIDNTIIAVFTDHYLYTLTDQTLIEGYKGTTNNLINKTPFFIWNNNKETKKVNEVTSQLNILPTLLNLFGLEYHPNYYIGEDALNKNYEGIVFFSDYSWYNGKVYVDGGIVTNDKYIDPLELDDKNYYINYIIRKNDLTLKYNYFKTIKSKNDKNV